MAAERLSGSHCLDFDGGGAAEVDESANYPTRFLPRRGGRFEDPTLFGRLPSAGEGRDPIAVTAGTEPKNKPSRETC